jgi:midasin (ATPase involved in ribosome maturation)
MFIFLYSLASQILDNSNHTNKFKTSDGAYIDINLEDLQNDIAEFKTLDASSNLKSAKYTEISQKLEFLEEQ